VFFIRILFTKTISTEVLTLPPHAIKSPPMRFLVTLLSISAPIAGESTDCLINGSTGWHPGVPLASPAAVYLLLVPIDYLRRVLGSSSLQRCPPQCQRSTPLFPN
jgi:hypothetical protein